MKIEVLEDEDERLKIEVHDNLTLLNLLNENLWKQRGLDYAAYAQDHPYISKPVLVVKSRNPKKALLDAADRIVEDARDLRKQLERELKD
ncbi:MAG: hypothetical protein HYW26_05355 [Candidatus Aenigmarchaeota archaeon]|nr:hypothetical protein [Candidatus Aenigmarchaeota archaeon]